MFRLRFFLSSLFVLTLALLTFLSFSVTVFAEAQLSGCTGAVTGTTTLSNINAGRISFDAHRNASGRNEGLVDLSVAGEDGSGLAPAGLEYAACSEAGSGTFEGRSYTHNLKGWAFNTNLGFISFNCQDSRNDAGAGSGIACGSIDYGVRLAAAEADGSRDLIGYAWSPTFGWIQFNGSGSGPLTSGELQMDVRETLNVTLEGNSYTIEHHGNTPTGISYITINGGSTTAIMEGGTANFGEVNLTVLDFEYMEGPSPHLTFELERVIRSGSRSIDAGETMVVVFDGSSYEVSLDANTPPGASYIGVDGVYQWVNEGTVATFGDVYLFAKDSMYQEGPPPHLTFELQKPEAGSEDFDYGVTRASDGTLSGYAWTSAGVWMNFSGARIYLPGEEEVDDEDDCTARPWVCVSIDPDPSTLDFDIVGDGGVKVADGSDGYYVHIYLKDSDGVTALSEAEYPDLDEFLDSIAFTWEDSVKLNQLPAAVGSINQVGDALDGLQRPWSVASGAVTFKPMTFADFVPVAGEVGHYISGEKVASYAPTGGGNLSYTTATDPVYTVNNERPLYENLALRLEPNRLVLSRITFDELLDTDGNPAFAPVPVYPNGQVDLDFEFRPAVFVDDLYVADFQDQIVGYRGVVENVTIGTEFLGSLPADARDSAEVEFNLSYSQDNTRTDCGLVATDPVFDYNFVDNDDSLNFTASELVDGDNVQILATLPVSEGEEVDLPCAIAKAPRLTTEVSYTYDGKFVAYLSNHLPRIAQEGIYNPAVVIHGTVLSQLVGDVQAGKSIDTSGYVNVNKVRDTVNENLEKYLGDTNLKNNGSCTINVLNTASGFSPASGSSGGDGSKGTSAGGLSGILRGIVVPKGGGGSKPVPVTTCINKQHYIVFEVGNENVFYTKGNDVTLRLTSGVWNNSWVIISDGGNIFIDRDIYDPSDANAKLALVTFRDSDDYADSGHVYIHPDVQNIQATVVADGTLFSYIGSKTRLTTDGEPDWASYSEMVNTNDKQLKIDGAIFSRNTIGGADLDQGNDPKNYLLLGGGKVLRLEDINTVEDRMLAQLYDLNYLRLFRLAVETDEVGLPIDQSCLRPLTVDDFVAIRDGETLYGDREGVVCDGINSLRRYNPTNISGMAAGPDGDLVVPDGVDLAQGLNNVGEDATDFDPVYVFYVPPSRDSFLFSKAGTLSIN